MQTPRSPSSSGSLSDIAAQARRSTLKVPTRLTLITLWKISRSCGPCLEAVRWAQPMPAQQTEIRSPPGGVRGGVDRRLHRLGLHHVRLHEGGVLAELGGERLALLGVHVGDHHRGAALVQRPRRRGTEPRGPAGDQRACPLDLHRRGTLSYSRSRALRGGPSSISAVRPEAVPRVTPSRQGGRHWPAPLCRRGHRSGSRAGASKDVQRSAMRDAAALRETEPEPAEATRRRS